MKIVFAIQTIVLRETTFLFLPPKQGNQVIALLPTAKRKQMVILWSHSGINQVGVGKEENLTCTLLCKSGVHFLKLETLLESHLLSYYR